MKKAQKLKSQNVVQSGLPLLYLIVALFALRWTFVEPYVVPTGSMEPTLKTGDRLYALKCAYDVRFPFTDFIMFRTGKVKKGDVILFRNPKDPSITFVKRAVGLPGDKIEYRGARLFVNGEEVARQPFPTREVMYDIEGETHKSLFLETLAGIRHYMILDNSLDDYRGAQEYQTMPYRNETVPPDHVFAMGDNRDNSSDSRAWGFVPMQNLKGRAMFIWYSSWDTNLSDGDFSLRRLPELFVDFWRYLYDVVTGNAHVRSERIGTLIQ